MGGSKKRFSNSRAAKKAERELQKKIVDLGLDSPPSSPTRQILRPEKPRASDTHVEEPRYRQLLDYVVKSVMSQFGLIDYQPPDDLSLGDYFPFQEFVKVFKIVYVQSDLWFEHWKDFFTKHYFLFMEDREAYLNQLFKGLRFIYSRNRPFFDNLLAAHSFVLCATVYFSYNGWQQAVLHPFRVLASHFEAQLRIPFAKAGGFKGLAKFCENHDMLKLYEFFCERNITPEYRTLETDVKARVKKEVYDILEKYDYQLSRYPQKEDSEVTLQGTLAWVYHKDLDVKQKRIIGNEWRFKETKLLLKIVEKQAKEQGSPEESPQHVFKTTEEESGSTVHRPAILDQKIMDDLKMLLREFNTNIFDLEKKVESLLE